MSNAFGDYNYGGGYDYSGGYGYVPESGMSAGANVIGVIVGIYMTFLLLMLALVVLMYVFQSLSMYTIAKRRMIRHPWLAWIPFGSPWILGSISDQYQYVAKGKVRNRRKLLLGMSIAVAALAIVTQIVNAVLVVFATMSGSVEGFLSAVATLLGSLLILLVLGIVYTVFYYIALYDLYSSCDPDNNLTYLLLSIFLDVTQPFLMFACRKHDRGMPPRKQASQALPEEIIPVTPAEPAPVEEAPVEEPQAEQPTEE